MLVCVVSNQSQSRVAFAPYILNVLYLWLQATSDPRTTDFPSSQTFYPGATSSETALYEIKTDAIAIHSAVVDKSGYKLQPAGGTGGSRDEQQKDENFAISFRPDLKKGDFAITELAVDIDEKFNLDQLQPPNS